MANVPLGFERKRLQLDDGEKVKVDQRHSGTWLHLVLSIVIRGLERIGVISFGGSRWYTEATLRTNHQQAGAHIWKAVHTQLCLQPRHQGKRWLVRDRGPDCLK